MSETKCKDCGGPVINDTTPPPDGGPARNMSTRTWLAGKAIDEAGLKLRRADETDDRWGFEGGRTLEPGEDCFDAPENIAAVAVSIADAMLAELAKGGGR